MPYQLGERNAATRTSETLRRKKRTRRAIARMAESCTAVVSTIKRPLADLFARKHRAYE